MLHVGQVLNFKVNCGLKMQLRLSESRQAAVILHQCDTLPVLLLLLLLLPLLLTFPSSRLLYLSACVTLLSASVTRLLTLLPAGFSDLQTLQSDPDLRPVQGPELSAIINK